MLTQKVSGVSYVADHSMRQLQLQAVTQWDSQRDLRVFFPNNAGLVPALTEAPWKEFGTGESGATDPKWGLVCDFFIQGYKPALQIEQYSYQLPHSGGPMPTCRPYHRSDWIEFADSLNSWIPRVVFSFCYLSRGIRIWCSLPPLPAWLVLSTLKRWSSACQHVACTQQPLWICRNESAPLTGGLHGPTARLPLPPPHRGRKNSICFARWCFCFSIQDELWGLSWPASHQPAKKTRKICRWEWPSTASKAANSRNSQLPRQPAKFRLSAVHWVSQVLHLLAIYNML